MRDYESLIKNGRIPSRTYVEIHALHQVLNQWRSNQTLDPTPTLTAVSPRRTGCGSGALEESRSLACRAPLHFARRAELPLEVEQLILHSGAVVPTAIDLHRLLRPYDHQLLVVPTLAGAEADEIGLLV